MLTGGAANAAPQSKHPVADPRYHRFKFFLARSRSAATIGYREKYCEDMGAAFGHGVLRLRSAAASLRSEFVTFLIFRVFSTDNSLAFSVDFLQIQ